MYVYNFHHHSEIVDNNTCLSSVFLKTFKKYHGELRTAKGSLGPFITDVARRLYKGERCFENIVNGNVFFLTENEAQKNTHIPLISVKIGIFFYMNFTSYGYLLFSCEIPTELRTSAGNVIE
jgi:hypothetical protein